MNEPIDGTFQKLRELAQNLWWSWQPDIRAIFRELDPEIWSLVYHNPVALLQRSPRRRSPAGCRTSRCRPASTRPTAGCSSYLHGGESWGVVHAGPILARPVAYFSAEFGLHQSLPIYSGGLGRAGRRPPEEHERPGRARWSASACSTTRATSTSSSTRTAGSRTSTSRSPAPSCPSSRCSGPDGEQVRFSVELPGRDVFLRIWRVRGRAQRRCCCSTPATTPTRRRTRR